MARITFIEELAGDVINKSARQNQHHRTPESASSHARIVKAAYSVDVTIVTVCFNPLLAGRKELFLKNLDSVQAQEGVCLEHLIIDGASTDGTKEWLVDYINTNHDIRIFSKPDTGIYDAMNKGISLARGKYILFLNSDDYFHNPRGMAVSLARIRALQCNFTFAPIRFSDSSVRHNSPQLAPQKRLHRFLISWSFSHQSMLTSRSLLQELDGFDTSYHSAADYDLLLRMIAAGAKGCFVPLAFSTFTPGGFSYFEENAKLIKEECVCALQCFFKSFYSVEMNHQEVEYIFTHHVFLRKYIDIYKQIQRLIRERFIGIPMGLTTWLSRWFNYIKYYLKCMNSSVE